MVQFSDLPVELVNQIYQSCSKPSLQALSLVSSKISHAVTPLLYAEIDWVWDRRDYKDPPLHLLVRTVVERPRLAELVSGIRLNVHDSYLQEPLWGVAQYLQNISPPKFDHVDALMELVAREFPDDPRWRDQLAKGSLDALTALLLLKSQNLEVLGLGRGFVHASYFVGALFRKVILERPLGPNRFNRLREVRFGEDGPGWKVIGLHTSLDLLLPMFLLPSLRTFEFTLSDSEFFTSLMPSQVPQHTSLSTMRLWNSEIWPQDVRTLLLMAPSVRVFHCGICRANIFSQEYDPIDYLELNRSLSCAADTLEDLTVAVVWTSRSDRPEDGVLSVPEEGPMGSLQHFGHLSRVEIPVELLLGREPELGVLLSDLLPLQLQELCLTDHARTWTCIDDLVSGMADVGRSNTIWPIIDALDVYLGDRATTAPSLHTITLKHLGKAVTGHGPLSLEYEKLASDNGVHQTQPRHLRMIAEAANVTCSVLYCRSASEPQNKMVITMKVYDRKSPRVGMTEYIEY